MKKMLLIFCLLILGGLAFWRNYELTRMQNNSHEIIANGRIEAQIYYASSIRSGKVAEVVAEEGQDIKKGDLILVLESNELNAKKDAAIANKKRLEQSVIRAQKTLDQTTHLLTRNQNSYVQAQAQTAQLQSQLSIYQNDLKNAKQLRKQNLISASELLKQEKTLQVQINALKASKAAEQQAQASQKEAQSAIEQAKAGVEEAKAAVEQAQAEIDALESIHKDLQIYSPADGRIEYILVKPGVSIAAGQTPAAIIDPLDIEMDIFLSMKQIAKIKINQKAILNIDGISENIPVYVAKVAQKAQFTPKTVETIDERNKMLYKVTLKMQKDTAQQYLGYLKSGMTATAKIPLEAKNL